MRSGQRWLKAQLLAAATFVAVPDSMDTPRAASLPRYPCRYWANAFIRARSLPDRPLPFFGHRAPFASRTASNWA